MNRSRKTRRVAPIALAIALMLSACSAAAGPVDTDAYKTIVPTPDPPPAPEPTVLDPVDPALVGTWDVEQWLDSTGSHTLSMAYTFTGDGIYEYLLAECQSSTDCAIVSREQGYFQTPNGVLELSPQTASDDGPRSWPYQVGYLDPEVTISLELHLLNPDGSVQIFYGTP